MELAAFQARIGEKFDEDKLSQAFVTRGYLEAEHLKEKALGVGEDDDGTSDSESSSSSSSSEEEDERRLSEKDLDYIQRSSNANLILKGEDIIEDTILGYTRMAFPFLPEEGVIAVKNYLTTDEKLAHVSFHIGTKDLVFCKV